MKKNLLLCLASLSLCLSSFAQIAITQPGRRVNKLRPHYTVAAAAKTTAATASRCIAQTFANANPTAGIYVTSDSSTYTYTGSWGSYGDPLGYPTKFATALEYDGTSGAFTPIIQTTNTFDANENVVTSLQKMWNASTLTWDNQQLTTSTYDAMNNLMSAVSQSWDGVSAWVNSGKDTFTYSAANQKLSDTYQTWDVPTSAWLNSYTQTYHYFSGSNVDTNVFKIWDAGALAWVNSNNEYNIYDGLTNCIFTFDQYWDAPSSSWVDYQKTSYSNFIGHNAQTAILQNWNADSAAYVNYYRGLNTYNSYGQVTDSRSESWDTTSASWMIMDVDGEQHLYYEEYTTGIDRISDSGVAVHLYPVPAGNSLTIDIAWNEAQPFTVAFYNAAGILVRQLQVPAMLHYRDNVQLSDLPAGNYVVNISGSKGSSIQKLTIAR